MKLRSLFFILLFSSTHASALVPSLSGLAAKGFNVELKSPTYSNGALSTDQGGIIEGKNFYLQARNITYIRRDEEGVEVQRIEAEGSLFFRFQDHAYIGRRIEFDLNSQTGVIYDVVTETGPWYVGGSRLILKADGSSIIHDCTVSTSENEQDDWGIHASEVLLSKNSTLRAKNVRFLLFRKPVFWWPRFSKDLKEHSSSPIKYRFRYFGKHGPRLGLSYTFNVGENWQSRLLLDVSVTRGAGGGFELEYKNPDKKQERFSGFNYYAYDIKTTDTARMHRYRFQGKYTNSYFNDGLAFRTSYDKLSDDDFTSDFTSRGLDYGRAGPTEARIAKKEENWISSLNAKVRINSFQTVKQTLPLFQYTMRPMSIGETGWVLDNRFSAGYLDYRYAVQAPHVHDFHSSRIDFHQKTYHSFVGEYFVVTPNAGYRVIGYGNSPQSDAKLLAIGRAGVECHTRFCRGGESGFHQALEPYVQYDYVTAPSVSPPKHFIFDLEDGLFRQNILRFGARNFLRMPQNNEFLSQLNFDLYARAFFNTRTIPNSIPRIYLDGTYKPTAYMLFTLGSAWDTKHRNIDHFNVRSDVTVSENIAFGLEYRKRNSYAWRKVDPDNFMLDTFRTERSLRHSAVSDRRDTFLARLFMRLAPNVAVELISRNGWNRRHKPSYTEYECNLITLIRGAVQVTLNFQHREYENRYAIYFSLGASPPSATTAFNRIGQGNYTVP